MPKKTPQELTVDALKRLSFADLMALHDYFFGELEAANSSEPDAPDVVKEYNDKWNIVQTAIEGKYDDLVKRANQPPPTMEVY